MTTTTSSANLLMTMSLIMKRSELIRVFAWTYTHPSFLWYPLHKKIICLASKKLKRWWDEEIEKLPPAHAPYSEVWVGNKRKAANLWEMLAERSLNKLKVDDSRKLCLDCGDELEMLCDYCGGAGYCEDCVNEVVDGCVEDCEVCAQIFDVSRYRSRYRSDDSRGCCSCNDEVDCNCDVHVHSRCCVQCGGRLYVDIWLWS